MEQQQDKKQKVETDTKMVEQRMMAELHSVIRRHLGNRGKLHKMTVEVKWYTEEEMEKDEAEYQIWKQKMCAYLRSMVSPDGLSGFTTYKCYLDWKNLFCTPHNIN